MDSLQKIKDAIIVTRDYLNHEFLEYLRTAQSLNSNEWTWYIKTLQLIRGERFNISEKLYIECYDVLCIKIFQDEGEVFNTLCGEFVYLKERNLDLKEINLKVNNQYQRWRELFSKKANEIILEIELQQNAQKTQIVGVNALKRTYQDLISKGQIEVSLEKLLILFNENGNKIAINEVILYNSQFSQLKMQRNFNTISHAEVSKDEARITKGLIDVIDSHL
jgi:gluconate kinase